MTQQILQINFNFSNSRSEYETMTLPMAGPLAETPGLNWKVWLMDEANQEAGGIYLFNDEATAVRFAQEIAAMLSGDLPFHNVSIKQFEVLQAHSVITRGLPERLRTFNMMAAEALTAVPAIKPADAYHRLQAEPDLLVIDVRDAADIATTGTVPGAVNISYGALTYQADHTLPEEWQSPYLADYDRQIIITCIMGPLGALGGKLLHDMGFHHVQILDGGVQAWLEAGLPVEGNGRY